MRRITITALLIFLCSIIYAQPSNDDCETLIDLGEAPICPIIDTFNNVNTTGTLISNDPNFNIPTCFNGAAPDADVWFSFTTPADGSVLDVQIELTSVEGPNGGIVQPQMAVYRGDCGLDELQELLCVSAATGQTDIEMVLFGLTPGFQYFIRVEDWSASATPNWGDFVLCVKEPDIEFTMGTETSTGLCSGTLFDSGGPDNDYSNNENNTFTICPSETFSCINFDIVFFNTENNFDDLTFHSGASTADPVFVSLTGTGGVSSFGMDSDCVTIAFSSDGSVTSDGFELIWSCSNSPCVTTFITCGNPDEIPSLPFTETGLSTCGTLDAQSFGPCPFGVDVLDGEDYIFTYTSLGDECISVLVSGSDANTAVSVYDGCPEQATQCMGLAVNNSGDSAFISAVNIIDPGTYFIVVDNPLACTDFDITVESVDCPVQLPATEFCTDAITINGCGDENIPQIIQVSQTETPEPECIQTDVNNGGWGGIGDGHFTWFVFQAQTDGDFGFLANNGGEFEDSDIDLNVYGPVLSKDELCDFMKNNQPIRSTWAADNAGFEDVTGLTNINPIDGSNVEDEIEGAAGDGFVSMIPVVTGEWYVVLVNDFSGNIANGGIQMDFTQTTSGVLDASDELFTISQNMTACEGVPFEIEAFGGSLYEWFPSNGLSCTDCPNPTVVVNGPTTYQVAVSTACSLDTLSVDIAFLELDAGVDFDLCQNETTILGVQSNFLDAVYNWESIGAGTLSCTDCPNPTLDVTGIAEGVYPIVATASTPNCSDSDTILVNVLASVAPTYVVSEDMIICEGESIDLGGDMEPDVTYVWTSSNGFSSSESNPSIFPVEGATYYLEVTNSECPNPVIDSVQVDVVAVPTIPTISDETICQGEQFIISDIITDADVNYSWSPVNNVGDPDLANNIFTPTETTTYTLSAARGNCIVSESFTINVIQPAVVTIDEDVTICEDMEVVLNADANVPGSFIWNPGGVTGPTFSTGPLNMTTTYTVTFIDDDNCNSVDQSVTVNVVGGVTVDLSVDPMGEINQGNQVTITSETDPIDNNTYEWSTGATTSVITETVLNIPMETYSVTVTDDFGCTDEASISISVIEPEIDIPNAFTPDGDGVNDNFGLVIKGGNVDVLDFRIYNRWGDKIHEKTGLDHEWDGTIDGKIAPSDVYAYIVSYRKPNGEEVFMKGDVTLIR